MNQMKEMNVNDIYKSLSRIDAIAYDLKKVVPALTKKLMNEHSFISSMCDNANEDNALENIREDRAFLVELVDKLESENRALKREANEHLQKRLFGSDWTPEDELNAQMIEASDGMVGLSHV